MLVTSKHDALESWSAFDPETPCAEQHTELETRTRRFFKYRVRCLLNGLTKADVWISSLAKLREGIASVGYDPTCFSFDRLVRKCVTPTAAPIDLSELIEHARVCGFVTVDEVEKLLCGEPIDEVLDPRPPGLPQGPPIVLEKL